MTEAQKAFEGLSAAIHIIGRALSDAIEDHDQDMIRAMKRGLDQADKLADLVAALTSEPRSTPGPGAETAPKPE